jgi:hypothetical protein
MDLGDQEVLVLLLFDMKLHHCRRKNMGHYAKVINNIVVEVIVAEQDFINTLPDKWSWVETSYNMRGGVYYDNTTQLPYKDQKLATKTAGRKRKNYAGIGYRYDSERDAFIPPTPYPSWKLNEDTCLWEAPIPRPQDNKHYIWNEAGQEWTYTGYYFENGELKKE